MLEYKYKIGVILIFWLVATWYLFHFLLENKSITLLQSFYYSILLPPLLTLITTIIMMLVNEYTRIGMNAYSNLYNDKELSVEELIWLASES